jgi:hypothetical protein
VYCEDYAGYYTVILLFLAFHFYSAYFIYLVSCIGRAISWMSKRHAVVELSTTKDEYMETTHASKEAVWLQRLC